MRRLAVFSDAMNRAKAELKQQGFWQAEQISEQIMKKGGIRKEISKL